MSKKLEDTYILVKDKLGNIIMPTDLSSLNIIRAILACRIRDNEDIVYDNNWYSYNESAINFNENICEVISLKNITKYKDKIESLSIDAVTGVHTRETTKKLFYNHLDYAVKNQEPFAVIMADLDNFKGINDTYGHYAGDLVLNLVAQALKGKTRQKDQSRKEDIVGRFGGDEFVIIIKDIEYNVALKRMEEIRKAIEFIELDKEGIHIKGDTISLGLAYAGKKTLKEYSDDIEGLRTLLLTKADAALYDSKKSGRNKSTSYILK